MAAVISARNLRVERKDDGTEKAFVTVEIQAYDGLIIFEVGVENRGTRNDVLEAIRERLALLFQSAYQALSQAPLEYR
jgi:hypothetical protein